MQRKRKKYSTYFYLVYIFNVEVKTTTARQKIKGAKSKYTKKKAIHHHEGQ